MDQYRSFSVTEDKIEDEKIHKQAPTETSSSKGQAKYFHGVNSEFQTLKSGTCGNHVSKVYTYDDCYEFFKKYSLPNTKSPYNSLSL